jgi:teichuronic acid biosynthesis glycosyltransferase TuaG
MEHDLNQKSVDIILPNYNSELYISETINSVLNQNFKNWNLIIVDDNSNNKNKKF